MRLFSYFSQNVLFTIAVIAGVLSGYFQNPTLISGAESVSHIFISLLKLVSLPIIFLSLVSTASSMENVEELKVMGRLVSKYTILTTLIAALSALGLFILINPVLTTPLQGNADPHLESTSYFAYLLKVIPSNAVQPFLENNVIGVLILALLLSLAILTLPDENKKTLSLFFKSCFAAVMKITQWVVKGMPIAIWAFLVLFFRDLNLGLEVASLGLYLTVVISANLFQAFIVLPLILKAKGISPIRTAKAMMPALSLAFFSKSSSAALPLACNCAEVRLRIPRKIASFSLPLCTTINMNGCAAFILSTVLFVSMSSGVQYSMLEMLGWAFVATIAAIGNAGVPMGCYFLSGAILASMNVPLYLLGAILPFYSLIDMLESAINVWSDSCVTALVEKDVLKQGIVMATPSEATAEVAV
ncbi:dicarboxylate/amino acid:cation symporter [Criblamydia sequanensis]|uniref:Sodium:dicarboxylate symporter family protein n=1 Tax=Candidatus Criblamydia sequanensis CRIB-18 TaxID=1437425 RepID=A0A090CYU4_9BACT|nr:dicarboxylate/amino acid:cation symporter [Criblamydia sequanensis]CDR33912.1 Sodium:dicarboxylate symporter family protein [Criblamydia sequanensis CRIB-18]